MHTFFSGCRVFFPVLAVSALGTLPPGILNISVLHIAAGMGGSNAFVFALGAVLIEMAYGIATLGLLNRLEAGNRMFRRMELISLLILSGYGIHLLWYAFHHADPISSPVGSSDDFLFRGILLSAVNPVQIPFWFGWSLIFRGRGWLKKDMADRIAFATGIGVGSLIGFLPFMFAGLLMWADIARYGRNLNLISGVVLLATAAWQGLSLFRRGPRSGSS